MKKIYLIGKNINYSKSPFLQNALLKKLGRDDIEYEIKNLEENEVEPFLEQIEHDENVIGGKCNNSI